MFIVAACSNGSAPTDATLIPDPELTSMELPVRRAIAEARATVVVNPQSVEAWGRYGGVLDAHDMDDLAVICYRRAQQLAPHDFRWPYLLAIVLEEAGEPIEVIVPLYERTIELEPSFPLSYFRLGEARSRQGLLEQAREDYLTAIELHPDLAVAHRGAGQVLLLLGDVDEAIAQLERAEAITAGDRRVATALARAYARRGDESRAAVMAERAKALGDVLVLPDSVRYEVIRLQMTTTACRARAEAAMARGDLDAALVDIGHLLEESPDDVWAHLQTGRVALTRGGPDEAYPHLVRAAELSPDSPRVRITLASCLLRMGRVPEAVAQARRATELRPDNQLAHTTLAAALGRAGDPADAVRSFKQAAALGPINGLSHADWGTALLQLGDTPGAVDHLRQAVTLAPQYAHGHYLLGVVLERSGDAAGAEQAYRTAVSLDANSPARQRLQAIGQR